MSAIIVSLLSTLEEVVLLFELFPVWPLGYQGTAYLWECGAKVSSYNSSAGDLPHHGRGVDLYDSSS